MREARNAAKMMLVQISLDTKFFFNYKSLGKCFAYIEILAKAMCKIHAYD